MKIEIEYLQYLITLNSVGRQRIAFENKQIVKRIT